MSAPTEYQVNLIGIGSAMGDDHFGWSAVETYQRQFNEADWPGILVNFMPDAIPGPTLIDALGNADLNLIIDAMSGGGAPGSVTCLSESQILGGGLPQSTHGLSVPECIALARRLAFHPIEVVVVGIEMGAAPETADLLSCVDQVLTDRTQFLPSRLAR